MLSAVRQKMWEDGEMGIMARGSTAWLVLKNFVTLDWILWELVKVGNWEQSSTEERKFNTLRHRYTECHVTLWLKHNTRTITTRQYKSQLISRFTDVNLTNLRKKWPLTSSTQSESAKSMPSNVASYCFSFLCSSYCFFQLNLWPWKWTFK